MTKIEYTITVKISELWQYGSWRDAYVEAAKDGHGDAFMDEKGRTRTDMESIWRSQLKFDAYRWLAARFAPHKYADKIPLTQVNVNGQQMSPGGETQATDAPVNVITAEVLEDLRERRRKSIERIRQANAMEVTVK
ncbi:MAG TPA: hypothetical protein VIS96_11425 [Terrimicrobiaceae bacterium]